MLSISIVMWDQFPKLQTLNNELSNTLRQHLNKSPSDTQQDNEMSASLASAKPMPDPIRPPTVPAEPMSMGAAYARSQSGTKAAAGRAPALQAELDESMVSATAKKIETMSALIDALEAGDIDALNLDSINDFIADSDEAFDYISGEYLVTDDPALKEKLRIVLDNANNPEKLNLAVDLANSEFQDERETAYSWLMQSEQVDQPEVYNTLIDALENDENAKLYPNIISSLSSYTVGRDPQAKDRLLGRLERLSLNAQDDTAKAALAKMVDISQDRKTQDLLHAHITSSPLNLKIAAIQELPRISKPSKELVVELNAIMENPSAPQSLRQASVMSIVALENQGLLAAE